MIRIKKFKDNGFTIIELLTVFVIVSFAIVALFVGIQFAENQLFKNYRIRKAVLLASARLEYHNLYKSKTGNFLLEPDDIPIYGGNYQLDKPSFGHRVMVNFNTSYLRNYDYQIMTHNYIKTQIVVEAEWREPSRGNKLQKIKLVEDYYDKAQ